MAKFVSLERLSKFLEQIKTLITKKQAIPTVITTGSKKLTSSSSSWSQNYDASNPIVIPKGKNIITMSIRVINFCNYMFGSLMLNNTSVSDSEMNKYALNADMAFITILPVSMRADQLSSSVLQVGHASTVYVAEQDITVYPQFYSYLANVEFEYSINIINFPDSDLEVADSKSY